MFETIEKEKTYFKLWGQSSRGLSQARIHTSFYRSTEIGRIFHNKYTLNNKNTFQVEIWPISFMNDSETRHNIVVYSDYKNMRNFRLRRVIIRLWLRLTPFFFGQNGYLGLISTVA